jgi:hypothetical protein
VNGPYDGSAYVPYLTERAAPSLSPEYGPRFNPGTGTVYNGKGYGSVTAPATVNPNMPNIGTGTVYDGKGYGSVTAPTTLDPAQQGVMRYVRAHDSMESQRAPATVNPNVPNIGTGSVYDGQ